VSTHLRLLFIIDHAGSSSSTSFVIIIADNHLHHQHRNIVAAITDCGQRQHQQNLFLLLLATPRNYKLENPGLILDSFYH
jgi:tRNA U38,U39,U40 pseudouridine synthase TruA